jgi:hypothetical protein
MAIARVGRKMNILRIQQATGLWIWCSRIAQDSGSNLFQQFSYNWQIGNNSVIPADSFHRFDVTIIATAPRCQVCYMF